MGFFPSPKKIFKAPITALKSSPKENIKDFASAGKRLVHGDIKGSLNAAFRPGGNIQDRQDDHAKFVDEQKKKAAAAAPFNAGLDRIAQSRQRAGMTMGLGNNAYLPRQVNYQPQSFPGLGTGGIRERTLANVTQPFAQPNWGMPQFDQRLLSTSVPLAGGAIQNPYDVSQPQQPLPYGVPYSGLGGLNGGLRKFF